MHCFYIRKYKCICTTEWHAWWAWSMLQKATPQAFSLVHDITKTNRGTTTWWREDHFSMHVPKVSISLEIILTSPTPYPLQRKNDDTKQCKQRSDNIMLIMQFHKLCSSHAMHKMLDICKLTYISNILNLNLERGGWGGCKDHPFYEELWIFSWTAH